MLWRLAHRALEPERRGAAVNFQVSSNNEMRTVNVKQHPATSNPPQLGNNERLSLRPRPTPANGETVDYFKGEPAARVAGFCLT